MGKPKVASPRVVRAAAIVDGKRWELYEENPRSLDAGSSYKTDLPTFGKGAPARHRLFDYRNGEFVLDVPRGAKGKLRLRGKAVTLGQLQKRVKGSHLRVRLDRRAKGVLLLGTTKIVFQLAKPKPAEPKLPFPREFKPVWWAFIGGLYLACVGAASLVLGPFFIYLSYAELPVDREIEIDDRFAEIALIRTDKDKKPEEEDKKEEDVLAEEEEEKVAEKEIEKPKPEKELTERPKTYSKEAIEKARGVGIARVLGTLGGEGPGEVVDVFGSTSNQLDELMKQGMGSVVMAQGGDISPFVAGGEGISERGAAVGNVGLQTGNGPELDEGSTKRERKVKSKAKLSGTDIIGDVDKNAIRAFINHRKTALQHCYDKALRTQPDLQGKMTFTIVVSVMGTVTKAIIEEDGLGSASVRACATARIKSWRFPAQGAEEPAEVTFSVVFSGS